MKIYTQEEIDELYEDEIEDVICPYCIKYGKRVLLGPKILMNNEPRPANYENFLECPKCFWICPIFAAEKEATIKDAVETIDNPFESKSIIESLPRRTSKTGKLNPRGRKRQRDKNKLHDDPDINEEMRLHGVQSKLSMIQMFNQILIGL